MRATIGIRELRDRLTSTIRRVRAGESIEITHDGKPVALLTPLPKNRIARLLERSEVSTGRPLDHPLRRFPATGGLTASEALEEDRAEH